MFQHFINTLLKILAAKMFQHFINTLLTTLAAAVLGFVWGVAWTNGFEIPVKTKSTWICATVLGLGVLIWIALLVDATGHRC